MIFVDDFLLGKYDFFCTLLLALAGLRYISFERIDTFQCLCNVHCTEYDFPKIFFDFEKSAYRRTSYARNRLYFARINSIFESSGGCGANARSRKIHGAPCDAWTDVVRVKLVRPEYVSSANSETNLRINLFLFFEELIRELRNAGENTKPGSQCLEHIQCWSISQLKTISIVIECMFGCLAFPLVYNDATTLCVHATQSNKIDKSVRITAHMADCEMSHSLRLWCGAQVHRCTLQWTNLDFFFDHFFFSKQMTLRKT